MRRFMILAAILAMTSWLFPSPSPAQDLTGFALENTTVADRTLLAEWGVDLVSVDPASGRVTAIAPQGVIERASSAGFEPIALAPPPKFPAGYDDYHDYAESAAMLDEWVETHPDRVVKYSIGTTFEGRELWAVTIGDSGVENDPDKPAFLLVAQHHAREILSPEVALGFGRYLLDNDGVDPFVTALLERREIVIIPTLNPDGAEYDQAGTGFRLKRKNMSPSPPFPTFCSGTDLNRNYGVGWGGAGASAFPCMLTYRGDEAFSEYESSAMRDLIFERADVGTLVTLHTYSELILWPWSHQSEPIENQTDRESFETLGRAMADFNGYTPQRGAELYLASGDFIDWAWAEAGVFAFTFELSPASPLGGAFYPASSMIGPTVDANIEPLMLAAWLAEEPRRTLSTELWRLDVEAHGDGARVAWASVIETEAEGWNVRRDDASGNLNNAPIEPGQSSYSFDDEGPLTPGRTYIYTVEFVSSRDASFDQTFSVEWTAPGGDDDSGDDDADDDAQDDGDDDDDTDDSGDDDDDDSCGC